MDTVPIGDVIRARGNTRIPLSPLNARVMRFDAAAGIVELFPKRKKVAIIGFGGLTRLMAPVNDPTWEVWGLNHGYTIDALRDRDGRLRADRWFELHPTTPEVQRPDPEQYRKNNAPDDLDWLRGGCPMPIYIIAPDPLVPNGVVFPLDRIPYLGGADQEWPYASTFAFQIALAILEGFEEIGIYGLDFLQGRELLVEMQNVAWWVGFAVANGVKVTIPEQSSLLMHPRGLKYGYDYREEIDAVWAQIGILQRYTGMRYVAPVGYDPDAESERQRELVELKRLLAKYGQRLDRRPDEAARLLERSTPAAGWSPVSA